MEPFHAPSAGLFTTYLSLQFSSNTSTSTITLYVHAKGRKKPVATTVNWDSKDGILALQPYKDTPATDIACRQGTINELLYTGTASDEVVLGTLASSVGPTDLADNYLDREGQEATTLPSTAGGLASKEELAQEKDCDENCDADTAELEVALSDVLACPGPGGNYVPIENLPTAASIPTPLTRAYVKLSMEKVFQELSNVLFCRGILCAAYLPVSPQQELANGFISFIAAMLALLFLGLEDFEPVANLPHGVATLQTPKFWWLAPLERRLCSRKGSICSAGNFP
jgi:hypothetical protein